MAVIEVIRTSERLLDFVPEWKRFLQTTPPPTPFQTPEWLLTWWNHFGSGALHVMIFRNGAEPVGIVPCFLHDWDGRRQLTLIGSGITDYLDPVLEPGHRPAILELLASHLSDWSEWDVCNWQDLAADTPLRALGPVVDDTPCSRIELPESFEAFLARRPKDLRRNLRRYKEKAEAIGRLRFAVTQSADPALLSALVELHGARWREFGLPGTIEANHAAGFLRKVTVALAAEGMLLIFTVYFNERVAAILMALRNRTTIFGYLSAFDPASEHFGFGRELLAQAIRYAHRQGYRFWNFLRGDEPYKFSWGAEAIPKARLIRRR